MIRSSIYRVTNAFLTASSAPLRSDEDDWGYLLALQTPFSLHPRFRCTQTRTRRGIFHMAALSSLRTKGKMRQYFDRKVAEGKNKMTVINAIRSKLIHRIFVLVKENRKYDKNYIHSLA